ncbi:MAG: hypothetical protein CMF22_13115 [Idiomarinaceae bacterium]|nr:hypothetical protein [Idiomarinaceae bacterium]
MGTYQIDESTERVVFLKDGVLHSKRGEGRPYAARYVGDGQFVFADTLVYFEVVRDADGSVTGLNYYQLEDAEPEFSAKVSSEVTLREKVELTDEQIARLVGDYQLQPNFVISIRATNAGITRRRQGSLHFWSRHRRQMFYLMNSLVS